MFVVVVCEVKDIEVMVVIDVEFYLFGVMLKFFIFLINKGVKDCMMDVGLMM